MSLIQVLGLRRLGISFGFELKDSGSKRKLVQDTKNVGFDTKSFDLSFGIDTKSFDFGLDLQINI